MNNDLSAKLEPFVLLAKSARGAAAAQVATDATSAPGVYVFAELLDVPSIQALANVDEGRPLALLHLFAYGIWYHYRARSSFFPALSTAQETKLKHLTLMTLASHNRTLPYTELLGALEMSCERALEDLIIDVINAGLLAGKMYHHGKILHVDWVAGRDVRPNALPTLHTSVQNWAITAANLLQALHDEIRVTQLATATEAVRLELYKARQEERYAAQLAQEARERRAEASKSGSRRQQTDARSRRREGGPNGTRVGGPAGPGMWSR